MNRRSGWFIVSMGLLLIFGYLGLKGFGEWPSATNSAQRMAAAAEAGYGVCALLSALALWLGHRATMALVWTWAGLVSITAGMAPVVWGGADIALGTGAGAVSALIAVLVVWVVRRALRAAA